MNKIDKLIHEELLPIRQMFISYTQLSHNPLIHINPKVFTKCAVKIDEVITICREVGGKEENGKDIQLDNVKRSERIRDNTGGGQGGKRDINSGS